MLRKKHITESQPKQIYFSQYPSRGYMIKLKIIQEMEMVAVVVTLPVPIKKMEKLHCELHTPGPTHGPLCVLIFFYSTTCD